MHRKDFIKQVSIFTAAGTLLPNNVMGRLVDTDKEKLLSKIGVQLFSLPISLEKDFEGSIAMLSQMGFKEIEMFGPYEFSASSAKERWKSITPMLGFSGSGYFGHTEQEVKNVFLKYGMTTPAMHTDLDTLENNMESLGRAGENLGFEYTILPAIPDERRRTLDDYKKMADTFNKIGENAKKVGLKFAYHNHGYGLSEVEGQIPLQIILDNTDPNTVFLEMDLFWTISGNADPIEYLRKYKGRYRAMHLKDMKEKLTFSGDGGDASQWIPLFPNMTSAGSGVVDLKSIVPVALETGVEHFFVEQDMVKDPQIALRQSIDYLKTI